MSSGAPYLVVTVLLDGSARPAALTRSHGAAMQRAFTATQGLETAGLDLAELAIAPKAFENLRKGLGLPDDTVALYDVFPLASRLDAGLRRVAGQFLAAEALWAIEEQGMLKGVPPAEKLDLPKGWSKDPKDIRKRLVEAGAQDLGAQGIETFKEVKRRWDTSV
ncbi:MAG: hypothetical protein R3A78_15550 [Polyangiales bacterium]